MTDKSFVHAQRQAFNECMTTCEVDMKPHAHKAALVFGIVAIVCFGLWFFSGEIKTALDFVVGGIMDFFKFILAGIWSFILTLNLGGFFKMCLQVLAWPFSFSGTLHNAVAQLLPNIWMVDYPNFSVHYAALSISLPWTLTWISIYLVTIAYFVYTVFCWLRGYDRDWLYLKSLRFCVTWLPLTAFLVTLWTAPTHWATSDLMARLFFELSNPFLSFLITVLLFAAPWFVLEKIIKGNLEHTQSEARYLFYSKPQELLHYKSFGYISDDVYKHLYSRQSHLEHEIDSFSEEAWWRYRRGGLLFIAMIAFLGFMYVIQAYLFIEGFEFWIALIAAVLFSRFAVPKFAGFITCYPEIRKQFALVDKEIEEFNAELKPVLEKAEAQKEADIKKREAEEKTAISVLEDRARFASTALDNIQNLISIESVAANRANELVPLDDLKVKLQNTLDMLEDTIKDLK